MLDTPAVTGVLTVRSRTYVTVRGNETGDAAVAQLRAAAINAGVGISARRRGQLLLSSTADLARVVEQLRADKTTTRAMPLAKQAAAAAASDDPQVREFVDNLPRAQRRALARAGRQKGHPARCP